MNRSALITILCSCLVLHGCSSMRALPVAAVQEDSAALSVGDSIRVTLRSGEVRRLKLVAVERDVLTGVDLDSPRSATSLQIAIADVHALEVRKTSLLRSAGLGVGVLAVIAVGLVGYFVIKCGANGRKCSD
jgi:hypothetical protein